MTLRIAMLRTMMRYGSALLLLFACAPELEEQAQDDDPLTAAERSLLSPNARLWRTSGSLGRCGGWSVAEDFSTGRYNVHRWAIPFFTNGPTAVKLERTQGDWEPAIVVGTRAGDLLTVGQAGAESFAEVTLELDGLDAIDIYVTSRAAIDSGFVDGQPRDSEYIVSARHECTVPTGSWQSLADGLTQGGAEIPRRGLSNRTLASALGVSVEPYGDVVEIEGHAFVRGRASWFGGPNDTGVTSSETGAITGERLRSLNSPLNPSQATLQSRPDDYYYVAMRFDYTNVGRSFWRTARLLVINPDNGQAVVVRPVDWGPNTRTGRVIDLSPRALSDLGLTTDDNAWVSFAAAGSVTGVVASD